MDSTCGGPYWQSRHCQTSTKSPHINDHEGGTQSLLFDLLHHLKKIEALIEGQQQRLDILEISLRSASSFSSGPPFPLCPNTPIDVAFPSTKHPFVAEQQCQGENHYGASMRMKYAFDDEDYGTPDLEDQLPCMETGKPASLRHQVSSKQLEIHHRNDPDVYSISIYTENVLTPELSVLMPSHFGKTPPEDAASSNTSFSPTPAGSSPRNSSNTDTNTSIPRETLSNSSHKSGTSRSEPSSHPGKAALAFLAYQNWKSVVWSRLRMVVRNYFKEGEKLHVSNLKLKQNDDGQRLGLGTATWEFIKFLVGKARGRLGRRKSVSADMDMCPVEVY
jgi:hypothetical protein